MKNCIQCGNPIPYAADSDCLCSICKPSEHTQEPPEGIYTTPPPRRHHGDDKTVWILNPDLEAEEIVNIDANQNVTIRCKCGAKIKISIEP